MGAWKDLREGLLRKDEETARVAATKIARVLLQHCESGGHLTGEDLDLCRETEMPKETRDLLEDGWSTSETFEVAIEQNVEAFLKVARSAVAGDVSALLALVPAMACTRGV